MDMEDIKCERLDVIESRVESLTENIHQLEVRLNDLFVAQQKSTPFKARIAFEKDVKEQLKEITQRLVLLQNNFARSTKTQASERESLMKTVQDIIDRVD
jgi:hypothetical protein